jgi:hypothetical protein
MANDSRKRAGVVFCVCSTFLALPALARAQTATASSPSVWHYSATLYGYIPSLRGESRFPNGAAGPDFLIDAHRIVRSLNFAFMGRVHVQKGAWAASADLFYADVGDSVSASRDFSVTGVPVPAGVTGNFKLRARTTLLTLTASYRLVAEPAQDVHLVFGTRLDATRQRLDWRLSSSLTGSAALSGSSSLSKTDWDAIIGLSGRRRFGDGLRWFVPWYADAGTGDSRFTGQALIGIGRAYAWGDVLAAWRYIDYRYRAGSLVSRLSFNGPAIGVTWRFR